MTSVAPPPGLVYPHDVQTSLTEREGRKLAALADSQTVLEMGAWLGASTILLAQTARAVHSLDWHRGDSHAGQQPTLVDYLQNLQRYGVYATVNVHIGRFEHIMPALCPGYFDLVFLDGFHSYEAVKADIDRAERVVRAGGVIAFHDYGVEGSSHGGEPFGVKEAVDERFEVRELVDTLAIVRL